MIIGNSNIATRSSRQYNAVSGAESTLSLWGTSKSAKLAKTGSKQVKSLPPFSLHGFGKDKDAFGQDIMEQFKTAAKNNIESRRVDSARERMRSINEMRYQTINYILNILLGKENKRTDMMKLADMNSSEGNDASNGYTASGGSFTQTNYYAESELTTYQTKGTVVTADGRSIDFNVDIALSRSFMEVSDTTVDWGNVQTTDPLVINLNSDIASVSDQKFLFDIDADGHKEAISMLSGGSGYLALDKNHNGTIDDGSELFGTTSGDGFKDLAVYDEDGNGWIDEADSVFKDLMVWTMDKSGKNTLVALGEAGVGAIYLGSSKADFSLTNSLNETQAIIRSSGVFLYENGNVGTIQQLDMAR